MNDRIMTTEEKAKAYDEALEKIKEGIKPLQDGKEISGVTKGFLEEVFPELKESEDERIRKSLLTFFQRFPYEIFGDLSSSTTEAIAWLEKQGEQKHLDYPYIPGWRENRPDNKPQINHSVLMLTTHSVAEGEWLGEEWRQYRWSCKVKDADVLYWLHLSDLESLEKEGEQKSVEWSEEDDKMLNSIIDDVMPFGECPDYPNEEERKYYYEGQKKVEWLKSLKRRFKED